MDKNPRLECIPISINSLPNEIYIRIFQLLPFKDLISAKKVNKRFYKIIDENHHHLRKKNALRVAIASNCRGDQLMVNLIISSFKKNCQPFFIKKHYKSFITDKKDLLKSLQMFDEKYISFIDIHGTDSPDIFKILGNWCRKGSYLETLSISDFGDDYLNTFNYFIDKISNVKDISIRHICTRKRSDQFLLKLGLQFMNKLEKIYLCECEHTLILNPKFILTLYKNNPKLEIIKLSSCNRSFIEDIIMDFGKNYHSNTNYPCKHNMITLYINTTHSINELIKTYKEIFYKLDYISSVNVLGKDNNYDELRIRKKCESCLIINKEIQMKFSNSVNTFH
ncbi:F-box domain-containing protein [Strongyloides ratti]|uniref:F-box domain-containing protein n=1 Tax=Strongyloides ratti TaxID=34506 RepID=A0A090L3P0_STRRB|nr:F-box domain-containing protein [Strongyloides ratti]CEF64436.1 F-box domain-containing protein [Strongyloides ratti]